MVKSSNVLICDKIEDPKNEAFLSKFGKFKFEILNYFCFKISKTGSKILFIRNPLPNIKISHCLFKS